MSNIKYTVEQVRNAKQLPHNLLQRIHSEIGVEIKGDTDWEDLIEMVRDKEEEIPKCEEQARLLDLIFILTTIQRHMDLERLLGEMQARVEAEKARADAINEIRVKDAAYERGQMIALKLKNAVNARGMMEVILEQAPTRAAETVTNTHEGHMEQPHKRRKPKASWKSLFADRHPLVEKIHELEAITRQDANEAASLMTKLYGTISEHLHDKTKAEEYRRNGEHVCIPTLSEEDEALIELHHAKALKTVGNAFGFPCEIYEHDVVISFESGVDFTAGLPAIN
jgi:hypothetical protein